MADSSALFVDVRQDGAIPLNVQFTCAADQVLAIYGPSGSGKTTILRTVAGLYRARHAVVRCGADEWTNTASRVDVPTHQRQVGVVFQEYALFPHLTVRGNVLAALGGHGGRASSEADRWISAVHLTDVAHRRPADLSGGERQRVAVARAFAGDPRVLLLDEPFAAVDRAIRAQLQSELDDLRRRTRIPVLLVTHDFQDVVRLATHVLMIDGGRTVASGSLADITSRADVPWSRMFADAGSVIDGVVRSIDEGRRLAEVSFDGGSFLVSHRLLHVGAAVRLRVPARDVILASRPPEGLSLHNVLKGAVADLTSTADDHRLVRVAIGGVHLLAEVTPDAVQRLALAPGAGVYALVKSVSIEVGF